MEKMTLVFGGSFNPPTLGHMKIIETLQERYPNALILVLPVGDDYTKSDLISVEHRINMLKLLTKDMKRVEVINLEGERPFLGTLESLDELAREYDNIHFVVGADQIDSFDKWINYKMLLSKYPFVVMNRYNYLNNEREPDFLKNIDHRFTYVDFNVNVSSSEVRNNQNLRKINLTKEVLNYIEEHSLYKENNTHV